MTFLLKTRKIFYFIFLIIPVVTFAAGLVPCGGPNEPECTPCDLLVLAQNVIHYALKIAVAVCIVLIIYGGFRWIFAFGDSNNIAAGQKVIFSALIGLVIILAAWLIVNTVFWLIAYMGGEDYTGTWWRIKCQ